ncbi:hypothetical protein IC582_020462 [Cucumis melo]
MSRRRRRKRRRIIIVNHIHPKSNIAFDMREKATFVKWVSLNISFLFRKRHRHAGDSNTAEKIPAVAGFPLVINHNIDGLVGKIFWVGDVEEELLIPVRIEISMFGMSPLFLVVKINLDKGAGGVAVFGHEVAGVEDFYYELGHGGGKERDRDWDP